MSPDDFKTDPNKLRLAVKWQDSVWFPPVLAQARFASRGRRPVHWPVQIITDPTVCAARTVQLLST